MLGFGVGSAAGAAVVAISLQAGGLAPAAVLLHVATLAAAGALWWRTEASSRLARQASSDVTALADHLGRLERQLQGPGAAATPALRSTMAEVTGTVGLLGGVVRELAKNVAAQTRDVADLRSTLQDTGKAREGERAALRIVPEPRSAQEPARDLPAAQPEPSLFPLRQTGAEADLSRVRLVSQAFEADRIELHLQPVVALPGRKVQFYEALARLSLADGSMIGPAEFLPQLERLGRAPDFDRRIVGRAIAIARHLKARGSEAVVTVNLSPRSVAEAGFLWSLVRLMEAASDIAGKIVLELPQQSWRALDSRQREAILALCGSGTPLSLDGASDLRCDPRDLTEHGVRFLKVPADMLLAAAEKDDDRDIGVRDFASLLRRAGVKLVAERVEREEMVPALVGLGIPLAQGFVFAAPRAVRAEVFGGPAPESRAPRSGDRPVQRRAG